jgi:hypothetical protein
MKIFSNQGPNEEKFCSNLGVALQTLIDQKFKYGDYGENPEDPSQPNYHPIRLIRESLYYNSKWDKNDKWLSFGESIIMRNCDEIPIYE